MSDSPGSDEPIAGTPPGNVSRRTFLQASGVVVLASSAPEILIGCGSSDPDDGTPGEDARFHVVRAEDLFVADIALFNLKRQADRLVRANPLQKAYVVLHLPRQHVLEQTVDENATPPAPPLQARLSGPTRLVFRAPDDTIDTPFLLADLLDAVRSWDLAVALNATPAAGVQPMGGRLPMLPPPFLARGPLSLIARRRHRTRVKVLSFHVPLLLPSDGPSDIATPETPSVPIQPGDLETSIELPFRLLLSPHRFSRFAHASEPVASSTQRVELWHTRLAARSASGMTDERSAELRTVRALWVRGQPFQPGNVAAVTEADDTPFPASLTPTDRNGIVHASSNFTLEPTGGAPAGPPAPIDVNRLMLTSLGGYLDASGEWSAREGLNLQAWSHRATMGRDHYVRVVTDGYLFPYGHRASLVTISERKIVPPSRVAYLWKRSFLIIREPVRAYVAGADLPGVGRTLRQLPFASVAFRELVSPSLDNPASKEAPFLPRVVQRVHRFPVTCVDRNGNLSQTEVAAVWVPGRPAQTWPQQANAARALLAQQEDGRASGFSRFDGQRVRMAPSDDDTTTFEAQSMTFGAADVSASEQATAGYDVPFLPVVEQAELAVEALRSFAGAADTLSFRFFEGYLQHGFGGGAGQNPGEILLEIVDGTLPVSFAGNADKSGGFLTPDMSVAGLSRRTGAVGGSLQSAATGDFDPAAFFKDALPKLFGVIPLTDILQLGQKLDAAPRFLTESLDEVEALLTDLGRLQQHLEALEAQVVQIAQQAQQVLASVAEVVTRLGSGDIAWLFPPGTGLSDLREAITSLHAAIDQVPQVPAGLRRFVREASDRVLEVLDLADRLKEAVERFRDAKELIQNRVVRLEFRPKIKGDPLGIFVPNRQDGLLLGAEIRAKAVGSKPAGADLICSLEDFEIHLVGNDPVFNLKFERMQLMMRSGQKPDLDIVFGGIEFGGVLSFIERIKDIIPLDGFSDPPNLEVSLQGIRANFSLPLPSVAVGIFALDNISISAGFHVPFLGDSITVSFGFCSRENPFTLTVSMLGGGGFVGLTLSPDGIRMLEISLEFGASLAVDFGVASGGVSIMAGIYFAIEDNVPSLLGYLRFRGEITVLGILSASLELYMELAYEGATKKVVGRASLKIEIRILCFSAGVTLEVERKFAGKNEDPTFAEVFAPCDPPALPTDTCGGPLPWADYVNAFAA
jgi:hypothetical protein